MEKKSYLEISQIAGIGVKGVERRISKALLQLREVLGNDLKF
jgi:RNA polymerase sigma-70 factor (ECF subfamily)